MNIIIQSGIPSLTVGGNVFTDLANLVKLVTYCGGSVQGSFRLPGGVAGYGVAPGKTTYKCKSVRAQASAANTLLIIGYADNDLGINSATVPTNPVYRGGNTLTSQFWLPAAQTPYEFDFPFDVPSGKILFITSGTINVQMYGYEV